MEHTNSVTTCDTCVGVYALIRLKLQTLSRTLARVKSEKQKEIEELEGGEIRLTDFTDKIVVGLYYIEESFIFFKFLILAFFIFSFAAIRSKESSHNENQISFAT